MTHADVIQQLVERWSARDVEGSVELFTDDAVMVPGPEWPEQVEWRGREGIRKNATDWLSVWDATRMEIHRLETFGDQVVIDGAWVTRGRSSGVAGSMPFFALLTLRDGKIARFEWATDHEAAVAATSAGVIRELARRWNSGDIEAVLDMYTEDVVMLSGPDWPEKTSWHGKEGIRENIEGWREAWESAEMAIERIDTFGDRVVAEGAWIARGRSSGVSGAMPISALCVIRHGKIASVEWFTDYDAAVAAARGDT
jgi:ketosteroid isomerase-like protein